MICICYCLILVFLKFVKNKIKVLHVELKVVVNIVDRSFRKLLQDKQCIYVLQTPGWELCS